MYIHSVASSCDRTYGNKPFR